MDSLAGQTCSQCSLPAFCTRENWAVGKERLRLTVEPSSPTLPYGLNSSPIRSSENAGHPQHRARLPSAIAAFPPPFWELGQADYTSQHARRRSAILLRRSAGHFGQVLLARAGSWPCSRLSPVPQSPGRPQPAAARAPGKVKSRGILFLPVALRGPALLSPSACLGSFLRRAGSRSPAPASRPAVLLLGPVRGNGALLSGSAGSATDAESAP